MMKISLVLTLTLTLTLTLALATTTSATSILILLSHTPSQRASLHSLASSASAPFDFLSAPELAAVVGAPAHVHAAVASAVADLAPQAKATVLPARDAVRIDNLDSHAHAQSVADALDSELAGLIDIVLVVGKGGSGSGLGPHSSVMATSRVGAGGVSPQTQRVLLGIPESEVGPGEGGVHVAVWGPGTFGVASSDLQQYYDEFGVKNNVDLVTKPDFPGTPGGDNWGEGTLDATQSSSIGLGVPIWVINSNASAGNDETPAFGYSFLAFAASTAAVNESSLPGVLSFSLGSVSFEACSRLCQTLVKEHPLHSLDECYNYVQYKQRQVCMFPSAVVADRIEAELAKITLRGVSMVGASGDGGSHFSFQPFDRFSTLGNDLNKISCASNSPTYPASSAYVMGVGGLNPPSSAGSNDQAPWPASGGGFSWDIARPSWQDKAVSAYLSNTKQPGASAFNASGRAYPDVAVLANDVPMVIGGQSVVSGGTSAAAPAMAGFLGLIVNARASAGKPNSGRLGLLPALIYAQNEKAPGTLFSTPINSGANSACASDGYCCPLDSSFLANDDFDVLTGLGRPIYNAWLSFLSGI